MTIIKHELKQGKISFIIWTVSIAFLLAICVFMFPQMKGQMDDVSGMFASMGSFSEAFGMDRLNFGTLIGFYSVECGNILGMGGAFFASFLAISSLSKEEKDSSAEFLLTHPISRIRIISEKLISVLIEVLAMNIFVYLVSVVCIMSIGEMVPFRELTLLHIANLLMQIELVGICFGVSAFLSRGSIGIGLGIGVMMYFLNIISNISDSAEFLKYITPFGYTEGADIVSDLSLNSGMVVIGVIITIVGISVAYIKYSKKDIA
ncbi:MAG: ABC transporter permease subunit [Acutalibacteraceae bacterium]